MGVPEEFAGKQEAVIDAYERLGIRLECTCTPYYLSNTHYGEHLAWAESSAVAYANSVIGARTNREGGPGALAARSSAGRHVTGCTSSWTASPRSGSPSSDRPT